MYPTTGYTPKEPRFCTRCHGLNDCELYELCDLCREGDDLAAWFDEEEYREKDRADMISYCRQGY